jgi:hypothetical protein
VTTERTWVKVGVEEDSVSAVAIDVTEVEPLVGEDRHGGSGSRSEGWKAPRPMQP